MGCILYKLSNLHMWEQRLEGGRERDRIHNCEAREKDRNRREGPTGEGTAVYPSSHREKSGQFHLERYVREKETLFLVLACDYESCPNHMCAVVTLRMKFVASSPW